MKTKKITYLWKKDDENLSRRRDSNTDTVKQRFFSTSIGPNIIK